MTVPKISVTRAVQTVTGGSDSGNLLSYAMNVTASNAQGFPPTGNAIFRMNLRPTDPNNPSSQPASDYRGVATPVDLTTLGVNNPLPGSTLYLASAINLVFATQDDAAGAWEQIINDVQSLAVALNEQSRLTTVETYTADGSLTAGGITGEFGG